MTLFIICIDRLACGKCPVNQVIQFGGCIFLIHRTIFRHLKLGIASAIPASNEEKYKRIRQDNG